jgi:hypothetical protein
MIEVLKQIQQCLKDKMYAHAEMYLSEAIAELKSQEPDAWMYQEYRDDDQFGWRDEIYFIQPPNDPIYFRNIVPVYAHPPQRTEQEPEWYHGVDERGCNHFYHKTELRPSAFSTPLYTTPPQRTEEKNNG